MGWSVDTPQQRVRLSPDESSLIIKMHDGMVVEEVLLGQVREVRPRTMVDAVQLGPDDRPRSPSRRHRHHMRHQLLVVWDVTPQVHWRRLNNASIVGNKLMVQNREGKVKKEHENKETYEDKSHKSKEHLLTLFGAVLDASFRNLHVFLLILMKLIYKSINLLKIFK